MRLPCRARPDVVRVSAAAGPRQANLSSPVRWSTDPPTPRRNLATPGVDLQRAGGVRVSQVGAITKVCDLTHSPRLTLHTSRAWVSMPLAALTTSAELSVSA